MAALNQTKQLLAGSDHPILNLEVVGESFSRHQTPAKRRRRCGSARSQPARFKWCGDLPAGTDLRAGIPIVLLNDGQITQAIPETGSQRQRSGLEPGAESGARAQPAAFAHRLPPAADAIDHPYSPISDLISDYAYSFHIDGEGSPQIDWVTESFQRITGYDAKSCWNWAAGRRWCILKMT
jgi:hypothetical protein